MTTLISAALRTARHVLLCLPLLGLWAAPAAQASESGWRDCANEGEVCRVANRGVVRYGVPGNWSTRSVRGDVLCSNEAFGDPAPNTPKRCEIAGYGGSGGSSSSNNGDWVFCAPEGETCRFRGSAEVRFGHGDRFTTRRAFGSVRCDVQDFGDPVYGVTKHCEVRRDAALNGSGGGNSGSWGGSGGSGGSWGGGNANWRYCSAEGQTCRVNGRVQVRFGNGQRFATRTVNGEVDCSTNVFGDPAYGQVKHCEVQTSGWSGSGGSGGGSSDWSRCAREGERCEFSGRTQVRYGTSGRYFYRDAWGGVNCENGNFGGDPYPNRPKSCEIRR
jgi:hypothetical protein